MKDWKQFALWEGWPFKCTKCAIFKRKVLNCVKVESVWFWLFHTKVEIVCQNLIGTNVRMSWQAPDMHLNRNGLEYMKACDAQCLFYAIGEAMAMFVNWFDWNNKFQGRGGNFGRNSKADLKQSSRTRVYGVGEKSQIMLECSTKCKSMTNAFWDIKGRGIKA